MTPYKVQLVQESKPIDHPMRFRFTKWVCDRLTKDTDFGKKKNHLFRWSSFWSGRVYTQAKLSHLGHAYIKKGHWAIFLRKWAMSQWRSISGLVGRIFLHKNWRGGYWQHLVSTGRRYVAHSRSYTRCFSPCFWRLRYQPQSWCRLVANVANILLFNFYQQKFIQHGPITSPLIVTTLLIFEEKWPNYASGPTSAANSDLL